jgi:hypothetical protein
LVDTIEKSKAYLDCGLTRKQTPLQIISTYSMVPWWLYPGVVWLQSGLPVEVIRWAIDKSEQDTLGF